MSPYHETEAGILYLGDCLEVMAGLPEGCADAVVADPPYNVGYEYDEFIDAIPDCDYREQQLDVLREAARVTGPSGHIWYLNYPETAAFIWCAVSEAVAGLVPFEWVTWVYHTHTGGKPLRKGTRAWLWFTKKADAIYDSAALCVPYRNPVDKRVAQRVAAGKTATAYDWWEFEQVKNVSQEKTGHPCQVPEAMLRRVIQTSCPPCGTVLDPFLGSGTTAVACVQTGRRYIGIELSEAYCEIAARRIEKALAQPRLPLDAPREKPRTEALAI